MKMKYFTAAVLSAFILLSLSSCRKVIGEGPVVSETRSVKEFSEIEFGVPGDMEFIESDRYEVEIEAQRNIIDVIDTYVSGNELRIKVRDSRNIRSSEAIRVTVRAPFVHSLALSGSGSMQAPAIRHDGLTKLRVSGSGKITVDNIETADLEAKISGSGSIEVFAGSADNEDINISGSGDIDIVAVNAKKASTQTSGSGNIRLNVSDELDVRISGSGDVFYKGTPAVNVSISGSGRLIKL